MKIYKHDLNEMVERNFTSQSIIFSCSMEDVENDQTIGNSEGKYIMPLF